MEWLKYLPIMAPVLIALLKKFAPKIPTWILPILAPLIGAGIDMANYYSTGHSLGPEWAAVLGAASVGMREIYDQLKQRITTPQ